jgi:hypothetical protein
VPVGSGPMVRYLVRFIRTYPNEPDDEHALAGEIECVVNASLGPLCRVRLEMRRELTFFIHPGNIGDSRFVGEGREAGSTALYVLEGFRARYD